MKPGNVQIFDSLIFFYDSTATQDNYRIRIIKVAVTCDTNGGEEEHIYVNGKKARGKETTRKIKM
jgi:hypothetical protein